MEYDINPFAIHREKTHSNNKSCKPSDNILLNYKPEKNSLLLTLAPCWDKKSQEESEGFEEIISKNLLVLNLNHTHSYGHIYSEVFSELIAVDESYPDYDCILTVLSPLMEKVITIFNLKLSNKIRFITTYDRNTYILNFEKLMVINHEPKTFRNKAYNVHKLKKIFDSAILIEETKKKYLLYCSRSNPRTAPHGRRLVQKNEDEIVEYLKGYAVENNLEFYFLTGEESDGSITPIQKQRKLFANSQLIIGVHGGVFSNTIFVDAQKKPKIIEFCPRKGRWFNILFDKAIEKYAGYYQILFDDLPEVTSLNGRAYANAIKHAEFTLDINKLKETLNKI
jgi:hypothetical protein